MSLTDGLAAVAAYGVLILVVDSMKNHTVGKLAGTTSVRRLGRLFLAPVFDYPQVVLPLAALWMLSVRVINVIMFSELLELSYAGIGGLMVSFAVILLLALPLILSSKDMLEEVYIVNGATNRAFRGHVIPWLFLVYWLASLKPDSYLLLASLWTVLFSVDFATACTRTRQRPVLVLVCVLALLICWSYLGGQFFFGQA